VGHAGEVENANFAANRASHAYTENIEQLSKQLEFTHDKMGLNTQFGYNQIRSVVSEGKSVGQNAQKSIVIMLPLPYDDSTDDKGSFFKKEEATWTPYGERYLGTGPATGGKRTLKTELEASLKKYPDYNFGFCFHLNQGADVLPDEHALSRLFGTRAKALKEERKTAITAKLRALESAVSSGSEAGDHFQLVNETADPFTSHHSSHFPLGLIVLYGDHKDHESQAPKKCDTKDLDSFMTAQPVGRLSYEFSREALDLPTGRDSGKVVAEQEKRADATEWLPPLLNHLDEATKRIKAVEAEQRDRHSNQVHPVG